VRRGGKGGQGSVKGRYKEKRKERGEVGTGRNRRRWEGE